MPYDQNTELPASVRSALPAEAQTQFRGAFNSASESGYSENRAFQIAWGAVKRNWKKGPDGKWVEKADTYKPTAAMASNARRALEVRAEKPPSQRGMTAVGLARARQLINRENLSLNTVKRMKAFFDRHQKDKQGATWSQKGKGWQAWMGWGGDEGWSWSKQIVRQANSEDKMQHEKMPQLSIAGSAEKSCASCSHYEKRYCNYHGMRTHEKETCSHHTKKTEKSLGFEVVKADDDEMLAFGWLYVAKMEDGRQVVDTSGDVIDVPTLEKASYEFVLKYRDAGERHQKEDGEIKPVGKLVECMVFTPEKIEALGIPDGVMKQGIWVGFKIDEPETWEKVKSGEYKMFSLGGTAIPKLIGG